MSAPDFDLMRVELTRRQWADLIGALRRVSPVDHLNPVTDPEACLARLLVVLADGPAHDATSLAAAIRLYAMAQRGDAPVTAPDGPPELTPLYERSTSL